MLLSRTETIQCDGRDCEEVLDDLDVTNTSTVNEILANSWGYEYSRGVELYYCPACTNARCEPENQS